MGAPSYLPCPPPPSAALQPASRDPKRGFVVPALEPFPPWDAGGHSTATETALPDCWRWIISTELQVRDSRQRLGGRWSPLRERNLAETCPQGPRYGATRDHQPVWAAQQPASLPAQLHTIIKIAQNIASHGVVKHVPLLHYIASACIELVQNVASYVVKHFPPFIASACIANHPIAPERFEQ